MKDQVGHARGGLKLIYCRVEIRVADVPVPTSLSNPEPGNPIEWDTVVEDTHRLWDPNRPTAVNPTGLRAPTNAAALVIPHACLATVEFNCRYTFGSRGAITGVVAHPDGSSKQFIRSEHAAGAGGLQSLHGFCTIRAWPGDVLFLDAWCNSGAVTAILHDPGTYLSVSEVPRSRTRIPSGGIEYQT